MAEAHSKPVVVNTSPAARILIAGVRGYQVSLGKLIGGHCRFAPSCSHYAIEALITHGACRGAWLTLKRLARCHPFGGSGSDPVPPCSHSHR